MLLNKGLLINAVMLMLVTDYLGALQDVSAQDASTDFFGKINDAEHSVGYRDYIEMGCWQCHGFQGAAGRPLIAPLMTYEAFANQVRKPYGSMPAYSTNILTDEQLRKIYQYLENLAPVPDASKIPLLSGD